MDDHLIYLCIGSNINPEQNIVQAIILLNEVVVVESVSTAWETQAVGSSGPNFINIATRIRSSLSVEKFKREIIRTIESQLGRVRTADKNSPRTIDIDILVVDNQIADDQIWSSAHLAVPLSELTPDLIHPNTKEQLKPVANQLIKTTLVEPRPEISRMVAKFLS